MKRLAEFAKTTLTGDLPIILPIYVAGLLLLEAVKGLLLLVASRNSGPVPASSSRLDEIHYVCRSSVIDAGLLRRSGVGEVEGLVARTNKSGQQVIHHRLGLAAFALCLTLGACGTPVSVDRLDARTVQSKLTSNAVTTGRLSESTQIVLRRLDLLGVYNEDRPAAIRSLSIIQAADIDNRDLVYALAEMTSLQAESTDDRSYFLATVVYSYAFLFPASPANRPNPFDPRLRTAADLYNRALARGLTAADGHHVELREGDYPLPFGTLSITFDRNALRWAGFELTGFTPAAELHIEGLQNRYRESGIGSPLAADLTPIGDPRGFQVARLLKLPVTAVLRLNITAEAFSDGRFTGNLMLYPGNENRMVTIGGQEVPLEHEPSAAFAYALSNPAIWNTELAGFFRGDLFDTIPTQLVALEPYRPGRIPVVLIHGTASSAGRWADLINDLQNDPAIHERFQFWLFMYNTGNPIPLSALQLRTALKAAISKLDPDPHDPALHNLVLIGHSQGGLLAKLLVINSGSKLYDAFSSKPIDQLILTDANRETLRQALFLTPLSDVTRVIFIATPHRGSYVAGHSLAHLIGRFVTLPLRVTRLAAEALTGNRDALRLDMAKVRLGSVYGMTPGSPFSQTVSSIPVAPSVTAHSIIAVNGDGPVGSGDDGVVEYRSAHIDEAASELVVRSDHSVQSNPRAAAEVRRILLLQWQSACSRGCPTDDAKAVKAEATQLRSPIRRLAPVGP